MAEAPLESLHQPTVGPPLFRQGMRDGELFYAARSLSLSAKTGPDGIDHIILYMIWRKQIGLTRRLCRGKMLVFVQIAQKRL